MRLIDADELKKAFDFDSDVELTCSVVHFGIDNAPTVDAVPVVRCKNCKYFDAEWKLCNNFRNGTSPEHYCSAGRRRE